MAILAIAMLGWELDEDVKSILAGKGDDHVRDVIFFGSCAAILSWALSGIHMAGWSFISLYFGFRVLLFDYVLNKLMHWPVYHFRNKGFDRLFYDREPWFVWSLKGTLFAILATPTIILILW